MWFLYIAVLIIIMIIIIIVNVLDKIIYSEFHRAQKICPGPKIHFPYAGSATAFFGKEPIEYFHLMNDMTNSYGNIFVITFLRYQIFMLSNHRDMEIVLSSTTLLRKGYSYQSVIPWIGNGLLTSHGEKWRRRRKMLTPAFHFKILYEFLHIFNKNGQILCDILEQKVNEGPFDIYPFFQLAALDNIYETAMGVSKNLQSNPDTDYVRAVRDICSVVTARTFQPHLRYGKIFRFSEQYQKAKNALKLLHGATHSLIAQRKKELQENSEEDSADMGLYEGKRRFAFLDMLLKEAARNNLTDNDIREEVDTFLFEGHDTVTSGLSFAIFVIAAHPEIQEKIYLEQFKIFEDSDRAPTFKDIQEMKYLEKVIKESQRLYPSVPFFERRAKESIVLSNGLQTPSNAQLGFNIYRLHRDPEVWTNPETFDPENFAAEAIQKRHPYAYVPFSAGPRNCIGQRFALLELKSTISKVIRRFKLLPSSKKEHKLEVFTELVLISKSGFHIQLERRK